MASATMRSRTPSRKILPPAATCCCVRSWNGPTRRRSEEFVGFVDLASPPPQPAPIEGAGEDGGASIEFPPPLWGRVRVGGEAVRRSNTGKVHRRMAGKASLKVVSDQTGTAEVP